MLNRQNIQRIFGETISSSLARNTASLYGAMVFNLILGYVVVKINSSLLGVEKFGIYSFVLNTILFSRVLLNFGLFEGGANFLARQQNPKDMRHAFAALLLLTLIPALLMWLGLLLAAPLVDRFFEIKAGSLIAFFALFSFPVLLQAFLQNGLRGSGHIKLLSIFTSVPRIFYIILMLLLYAGGLFSLKGTLSAYLGTMLLAAIIFIIPLKPLFSQSITWMKKILAEVRSFGSHIYVANAMTALFQHSDKIILAYFVSSRQLGYYALAYALTFPLSHFPNALGTSAFRSYAQRKRIGKKHFAVNTTVVILAGTALIVSREFIITVLFSERFAEAQTVFVLLVIAFGLGALAIPLTLFFKAKGKGLHVRNITITAQLLYLLLMFVLVPMYGINGAAWAAIVAFTLDLILYFYFYKKLFPA